MPTYLAIAYPGTDDELVMPLCMSCVAEGAADGVKDLLTLTRYEFGEKCESCGAFIPAASELPLEEFLEFLATEPSREALSERLLTHFEPGIK
jgi:hypothetical protein